MLLFVGDAPAPSGPSPFSLVWAPASAGELLLRLSEVHERLKRSEVERKDVFVLKTRAQQRRGVLLGMSEDGMVLSMGRTGKSEVWGGPTRFIYPVEGCRRGANSFLRRRGLFTLLFSSCLLLHVPSQSGGHPRAIFGVLTRSCSGPGRVRVGSRAPAPFREQFHACGSQSYHWA